MTDHLTFGLKKESSIRMHANAKNKPFYESSHFASMASTMATTCQVAPLGKNNYSTWMPEMRAYLAEQKVWFIVAGKDTRPLDATQAIVWHNKAATTVGAIYRALEPGQRVHVASIEMDPVKMWEKLAAVHVQKISGACFSILDALLAVRKSPDEFLPSVVA
jgi:hypothetical protein